MIDFFHRRSSDRPLFPTPLTVFEEYMLLDDKTAYPMDILRRLRFVGRFDVERWRLALERTVARHPLFSCRVEKIGGRFYWIPTEKPFPFEAIRREKIKDDDASEQRLRIADDADKIKIETPFFPKTRPIDLARETAIRAAVVWDDSSADVFLQYHHAATDGIGEERFLRDVLLEYAVLGGALDARFLSKDVDPEALRARGSFGLTLKSYFRNYFHTFATTTRFLFVNPRPFWSTPPNENAVEEKQFNIFSKQKSNSVVFDRSCPLDRPQLVLLPLSIDETTRVFQTAKNSNCTVNDLLLAALFATIDRGRKERGEAVRGTTRIAVPMNLRTKKNRNAPACNVVTMIFLDLPSSARRDPIRLLNETRRRMNVVKRNDQKYFLDLTLKTGRFLAGLVGKDLSIFLDSNRCRATATLSNLGRVFNDVPFERTDDGRLKIGDSLVLDALDVAAPIREASTLSIVATTYAGKLRFCLRYDVEFLTSKEAVAFLSDFRDVCVDGFSTPTR